MVVHYRLPEGNYIVYYFIIYMYIYYITIIYIFIISLLSIYLLYSIIYRNFLLAYIGNYGT